MLVIQPSDRVLVGGEPHAEGGVLCACFTDRGGSKIVPADVARADKEDVGWSWEGALKPQSLFDLEDGDFVPRRRGRRITVRLLIPAKPIHQDPSTDDPTAFADIV